MSNAAPQPATRKQAAASFLAAAAFFALHLAVFRPGYNVNDDIDLIGLASGYFTGKPVPFLPNSNVLWGLFLGWLSGINRGINWEIWLFIGINFASVWLLLYLILSASRPVAWRLFGAAVVLVCDSYFLLNITFTTTAAFAALAGACALLSAVRSGGPPRRVPAFCGALLIVLAGLIRIAPMLLVLLIILPPLLVSYRLFDLRKLLIAAGATALVVLGFYTFNVLYVGASPEWSAFYKFNVARESLKDTPRLANVTDQYQAVGWSKNDLREFSGWFFPDAELYSTAKLEYLAGHVSNRQPSKVQTVLALGGMLAGLPSVPYLLLIAAVWLGIPLSGSGRRALLPLALLTAGLFALDLYITWTMKLPYRVLLPSLAAGAIFGFCLLDWSAPEGAPSGRAALYRRLCLAAVPVLLVAALLIAVAQAITSTQSNLRKQDDYRRILSDLDMLQRQGTIVPDALILAPAYGIPLEWSDPLRMDFPSIRYLDMGWMTLSPAYDDLLREFGVASIPAGFYQDQNVYLMTRSDSLEGIRQFIQEHQGVNVRFVSLYALPENPDASEYAGVNLYRVEESAGSAGK